MKVISFSFADSQLTRNILCETLFDSILPPELEPEWMSWGGREGKNMSPSCEAQIPLVVHTHHGLLARLSEFAKEV